MSPRPYQLGQRQAAIEKTRARIISAARELLMENSGYARCSIDAVARQADVARMTVYHQFGSKIGLLEALCDALAASGGMQQMATAFCQSEPLDALKGYLLVFGHFFITEHLGCDRDIATQPALLREPVSLSHRVGSARHYSDETQGGNVTDGRTRLVEVWKRHKTIERSCH